MQKTNQCKGSARMKGVSKMCGLIKLFKRGRRAFPGAKGFGAYSQGGRKGVVLVVDTLSDSPETNRMSLRKAIETPGRRIIRFTVGGVIALERSLYIRYPYLTIEGQTAPAPGITLANYGLNMVSPAHDIVVRYLRIRPLAQDRLSNSVDGIQIYGDDPDYPIDRIIIDHCSIAWALDEGVAITAHVLNWTVQNCFIIEGARYGHVKEDHSMAMLLAGMKSRGSILYNLIAHCSDRNPKMTGGSSDTVYDFRCNVIYNWLRRNAGNITGPMNVNVVDNVFIAGQDVTVDPNSWIFNLPANPPYPRVYFDGNEGPNKLCNWTSGIRHHGYPERYKLNKRIRTPDYKRKIAIQVLHKVLYRSGANLPVRDKIDRRIVREILDALGDDDEQMMPYGPAWGAPRAIDDGKTILVPTLADLKRELPE